MGDVQPAVKPPKSLNGHAVTLDTNTISAITMSLEVHKNVKAYCFRGPRSVGNKSPKNIADPFQLGVFNGMYG